MKLTLKEIRPESSDVTSFLFEPEAGLTWQAGQYLHYTLPHPDADERGVRRYFTVSSAPQERHVRLTTRRAAERGSTFKRALFALEPGATVDAEAPAGSFTIEEPEGRYLLVAGGIGITPFRAILVDLARRDRPLAGRLLYANRNDEIVFRDELDRLAEADADFSIRYLVSPERLGERTIADEIAAHEPTSFWVSGPKPMVDAVQELLLAQGAPEGSIKRDAFPGYE
jgi:ferredoxin-NADP reductase